MGRKIIAIKKLYDKNARNYAYAQRKRGLLKKCIELSILCEQQIFLAIYDKKSQTMVEFQSSDEFSAKKIVQLKKTPFKDHQFYENSDLDALQNNNMTRAQMREIFKAKKAVQSSSEEDLESQQSVKKTSKNKDHSTSKKGKKRTFKSAQKNSLDERSDTTETENTENSSQIWPSVVCVLNEPIATNDSGEDNQLTPAPIKISQDTPYKIQRLCDNYTEQSSMGLCLDLPTPQRVSITVEGQVPKHSYSSPQMVLLGAKSEGQPALQQMVPPAQIINKMIVNVDIVDQVLSTSSSKDFWTYNGCSPIIQPPHSINLL